MKTDFNSIVKNQYGVTRTSKKLGRPSKNAKGQKMKSNGLRDTGRPPKINDFIIAKLEEVFSLGGTIDEACIHADINPSTYHRWCKENPKLKDREKQLRQLMILKAKTTIFNSIEQPHIAQWYLERKARNEFSTKTETDLNIKETIVRKIGQKNDI